jgi:hypothetical protein
MVQAILKIQLEVGLVMDTLQECHNTGAAQLKRLKAVPKVMKKYLDSAG